MIMMIKHSNTIKVKWCVCVKLKHGTLVVYVMKRLSVIGNGVPQ